MSLHHCQLTLDAVQAARLVSGAPARDPSFVVKTALTEALGGPLVRPWRLHAQLGRQLTVLGYSDLDAGSLRQRLALALPEAQAAVSDLYSSPLPEVGPDTRLRFRIRLSPTVRVTPREGRRHGERDAFLVAVDEAGGRPVDRLQVYADYLRARTGGADLDAVLLDGFRLQRLTRKAGPGFATKTVPVADLYGELSVRDWAALLDTLRQGIGRQRAYGCGMLRLEVAR